MLQQNKIMTLLFFSTHSAPSPHKTDDLQTIKYHKLVTNKGTTPTPLVDY